MSFFLSLLKKLLTYIFYCSHHPGVFWSIGIKVMVHVHTEKLDALETYLVNYLSFKNTVFGEMDADEATSPPLPRTVPDFWVFEGHNQPGASLVPLEPCNQVPSYQVPP